MTTLLVELFTEELPPKALARLGRAFAEELHKGLTSRGLASPKSTATIYATPRRLAAAITEVTDKGSDSKVEKKLMPAKVAFDAAGAPSASLQKRLEKENATAADISLRKEGPEGNSGDFAWLVQTLPGASLQEGLQAALTEAIARLPIPKVMRYQPDGAAWTDPFIEFVRPAHGLVALYGSEVIPVSALGLKAGRITHGHRFQGAADISLKSADSYSQQLQEEGAVIASFDERKSAIRTWLDAAAKKEDANLGESADVEALLDEVNALVERPAVYVGEFEAEFLAVPQECLILTMRLNQKYFPLFDASGKLKNRFLIVSNMQLDDPKNIVEGNQRVVRPRLSDAKFFFDFDRREKLESRLAALGSVVYHNKLGTQGERVKRLEQLAGAIADSLKFDATKAKRAALLAKADLVTNMVGEFPELQGIMGRYYATHDKEDPEVAQAIEEHYQPRFAGDALPATNAGTCAALADKLDSLAGIFAIGLIPTGDKDPFALRRAALGVIRILIEKSLPVSLKQIVEAAFKGVVAKASDADAVAKILDFIYERLRGYLKDRGYSFDEIEAVVSQRPERLDQVIPRIEAVRAFRALPEAEALAAANKRVINILRKSESKPGAVNAALLTEDAEKALHVALAAAKPEADAAFAKGDYAASLKRLAGLRGAVDLFFDKVMVNAEDPAVRANRLGLLAELGHLFNQVADISKLAA
ncbi:MAG: glycine--tRNA ligase subunit beta [Betaproteobacteria bacterium]|nr:glycine--tRNA ligase subunit beta [Betaproteobacteria bacterium]